MKHYEMYHQYKDFNGDMKQDSSVPNFDIQYSKLAMQHLLFTYSRMKEMNEHEAFFDQTDILAADGMSE